MDGLTPVANKVNFSTVSGNAQSMVLHARTSANVTKDKNLNMLVCWVLSWAATGRDAVVEATANPSKDPDAIVEKDDKDAACNDGQEERDQHCKQPSLDCLLQSLCGRFRRALELARWLD